MRVRRVAYVFVPVAVVASIVATTISPVGAEEAADTSAATVLDVLQDDPALLAASASVTTRSDADSAVITSVAGTTVDAPKDAAEGVDLGLGGNQLSVQLPGASDAGAGQKIANGTVAYPSDGPTANAVQATAGGEVKMLTVVNSADAPDSFAYELEVPGGGSVQLTEGGGAAVLDSAGQVVAGVKTPWAEDASGAHLRTWFTTDGTALTQHVDYTGAAFPVTVDPWWSPFLTAFRWAGTGAKILVKKVGPWAVVLCLTGSGWAWYRSDSQGWVRVGDAVIGCIA
jgi:hypothetical protein